MLILLFCILVLFIYNIIGLMEKERETAKKKDIILANIETLRNRESILTTDINKLKTEDGIEETIRDKYQVVKEGEKMVTIVDEEKKNNVEVEAPVKDSSFLGWIKRLFKIK
ncbi:MAG: septum formation initiator family protein [Candidatus Nomurabacteria bacterium]|nr:septum formation initiator family protein [Candidatus Nomurabacteria bacterium]